METITNIKINYMLIEYILKAMGLYKDICEVYSDDSLDDIFKQAKTGVLGNGADAIFAIISNITNLPKKYISGENRIKLGIRCKTDNIKNKDAHDINQTINTIDLEVSDDSDNITYDDIINNPLNIDFDKIYFNSVSYFTDMYSLGKDEGTRVESEIINNQSKIDCIGSLYSLNGLLRVVLSNMKDHLVFVNKRMTFIYHKWDPYIRNTKRKDGITKCPKYVEIRNGLIQDVIQNIDYFWGEHIDC